MAYHNRHFDKPILLSRTKKKKKNSNVRVIVNIVLYRRFCLVDAINADPFIHDITTDFSCCVYSLFILYCSYFFLNEVYIRLVPIVLEIFAACIEVEMIMENNSSLRQHRPVSIGKLLIRFRTNYRTKIYLKKNINI